MLSYQLITCFFIKHSFCVCQWWEQNTELGEYLLLPILAFLVWHRIREYRFSASSLVLTSKFHLVLTFLKRNRSEKEVRAAALVLQTIWGYKELRKPLEKEGWKKSDFQVEQLWGLRRVLFCPGSHVPLCLWFLLLHCHKKSYFIPSLS